MGKCMSDCNWQWHQLCRLIARITKHQPLIAGTLFIKWIDGLLGALFECSIHPLCNIGGLFSQRETYPARISVETTFAAVITDIKNH